MVVSLNCFSHTNTQHDSQTRMGVDSGQEGSGKTYEEALLLLLSWRHISLYKVTIHPVSIVKKKKRSNEKQLYVPSLTCSIYVQYTNARVYVCVCVRVRSLSGEGYNVLFLCPCFFFFWMRDGRYVLWGTTSQLHQGVPIQSTRCTTEILSSARSCATAAWKFQASADTTHLNLNHFSIRVNVCRQHSMLGTRRATQQWTIRQAAHPDDRLRRADVCQRWHQSNSPKVNFADLSDTTNTACHSPRTRQ